MKRLLDWLRGLFDRRQSTPSPSVAPSPPALGLNIHEATPSVVEWARSTGCRWIRTTFYVALAREDVDAYGRFLAGVRACKDAGFNVLVVVHSLGEDDPYGAMLHDALRDLVDVSAGMVDAIQLGNELNDANRWSPFLQSVAQYDRGREYARLYAECRAVVRPIPLIVAGVVGDPREFLEGVYAGGVTPDGIGCHVYGWPLSAADVVNVVAQSRRVFRGVPVWLTEIGSEGGRTLTPEGDARQVADLRTALDALGCLADVRGFWYCAAGDWGNALLSEGGGERPAGVVYREAETR